MDPKPPGSGMLFAPSAAVSNYLFPSADMRPTPQSGTTVRLDDRLVPSEDSPYEMIRGEKVLALPANAEHADAHLRAAVAVDLFLRDEYVAAVEMLTRVNEGSDFATDVSVRKKGIDPRTGERYLEELSFEIVNEQTSRAIETKARDLVTRGVRRVFAVFVKTGEIREWSRALDRFVTMNMRDTFDDVVLLRPMVVRALVDRTLAQVELIRTLEAQEHPEILRIRDEGLKKGRDEGLKKGRDEGLKKGRDEGLKKGRDEGLKKGRDEGLEEGRRQGIMDICEIVGILIDEPRAMYLDTLDAEALDTLREHIKRTKRWPE